MGNLIILFLVLVNLYIIYRMAYIQFKLFRPQGVRTAMYKFFAIRDALVMLVIEGAISENDKLFELYYTNINEVLRQFKEVNKISLADLLSLSKKLTKDELQNIETLIKKEKAHKSEELKNIIREYHAGIIDIILHNTTFATIVKIGTIPLVKYFSSKFAKKILSFFLKDSYAFYQEHKHALAAT